MRIAVFSRSTTEHFQSGGMESQLKTLIEELAARGHELTVITTSLDYKRKEKVRQRIKYIYIKETTPGLRPLTLYEKLFNTVGLLNRGVVREGKLNYFNESKITFERLYDKKPFDLVLSQSTSAQGILDSKYINGNIISLPILSIIHGAIKTEIRNRLKANKTFMNWGRFVFLDIPIGYWELYTSNRKFFKRVNKVIAVSNVLKEQFCIDHPKQKRKVLVIYNGVDDNRFTPGNSKFNMFTLLYVGRVDREKGLDLLIKAIRYLNEDGMKCQAKIVGSGIKKHIEELKNLVENYNLASKIEFVGSIPNDNVVKYYQKSHVFVLPTRREEGHPMSLSEALCSGLPVVATRMGGIKEVIKENETGFTFNSDCVEEFFKYLEYLYKNPKRLDEMAKYARKNGVERFGKSVMVSAYEKVFGTLVKS